MSIQRLQAHWGFTRMPFGRRPRTRGCCTATTATPKPSPGSAGASTEHRPGVITGEVGAGKTVAVRAATAALDTTRTRVIYLPNPSVGVRGMLHHIVATLGQVPSFYTATLVPQAAAALAAEHAERGRTPDRGLRRGAPAGHAQLEAVRMLTNHEMDSAGAVRLPSWSANRPCGGGCDWACSPHWINASPLRYTMPPMTADGDRQLHHATTSGWPGAATPCSPTTPSR